jgi:hypothetical protein
VKGKLPIKRIVAGVVAAGLLSLGIYLFREGGKGIREFHSMLALEPIRMEVDFSKRGNYSFSLPGFRYKPHGLLLRLEFDATDLEEDALRLKGLRYKVSFADNTQGVKGTAEVTGASSYEFSSSDDRMRVAKFSLLYPSVRGDLAVYVDIIEPVKSLQNRHQILMAEYSICGLEVIPAAIMRLGGIVVGGIGIAIIAVVVVIALKRRKKSSTTWSIDGTD